MRSFGLGTLLGYPYNWIAVGAILTTAVLGLIVSLSTFLVIGATSSVTFNVVRKPGRPLVKAMLKMSPCRCSSIVASTSDIRGACTVGKHGAPGECRWAT